MEEILCKFKDKVNLTDLIKYEEEIYMKIQQEKNNMKENNTRFYGELKMVGNKMLKELINNYGLNENLKIVKLIKEYFMIESIIEEILSTVIKIESTISKIHKLSVLDKD